MERGARRDGGTSGLGPWRPARGAERFVSGPGPWRPARGAERFVSGPGPWRPARGAERFVSPVSGPPLRRSERAEALAATIAHSPPPFSPRLPAKARRPEPPAIERTGHTPHPVEERLLFRQQSVAPNRPRSNERATRPIPSKKDSSPGNNPSPRTARDPSTDTLAPSRREQPPASTVGTGRRRPLRQRPDALGVSGARAPPGCARDRPGRPGRGSRSARPPSGCAR